jgi:hypothetical protein
MVLLDHLLEAVNARNSRALRVALLAAAAH